MDVILLEKVINLGNLGDQVKVKSGYARNFLLPNGKAVPRPVPRSWQHWVASLLPPMPVRKASCLVP